MSATTSTFEPNARYEAIDESGWGYDTKLVQPHNFTFWVMTFMFIAGAFHLYDNLVPSFDAYGTTVTQAIVWFTLYGLLIAWLIDKLDRYSPIPGKLRLVAFLWGGLVATFAMAIHYNNAFFSLLAKTQGIAFKNDWGPATAAPLSEEITKGLAVLVLIAVAPHAVRTATDGLILGAFSGLGFQLFEDVLYAQQASAGGFAETAPGILNAGQRTVLGFTGHWMWSGIFGAGLVYLLGRPMQPAKRGLGLALMVLPMVGHFLWNGSTSLLGGPPMSVAVPVMLAFSLLIFVVFISVYRMTLAPEQQTVRDVLGPEVDTGVITAEELDALVGRRKQRRAFIKSAGSRTESRQRKHVLEAAHDLADRIAKARGAETDDVRYARSEIARLRG